MEQSSVHPHPGRTMDVSPEQAEQRRIRGRGGVNAVIGGGLGALVLMWLLSVDRVSLSPWALVGGALPFVVAAVGLVEMGSGISIQRFGDAWGALHTWQRALFGMLVLVLTVLVLTGAAALAF